MKLTSNQQAEPTGAAAEPAVRDAQYVRDGHTWQARDNDQSSRAADTTGAVADVSAAPSRDAKRDGAKERAGTGINTRARGEQIKLELLTALNRFEVIRTFDVTAVCFADRSFKTALAAAQAAMKQLKKLEYVAHHRTDRNQHVFGLTEAGAKYLKARGVDAKATAKKVKGMSNPQHRLWGAFIVNCCEARGIPAFTEHERYSPLRYPSLQSGAKSNYVTFAPTLSEAAEQGGPSADTGIDTDSPAQPEQSAKKCLAPDAVAFEPDGATWFEIDWSERGSIRSTSLRKLISCIGESMPTGDVLRRVVVFAREGAAHAHSLSLLRKLIPKDGDVWRKLLQSSEGDEIALTERQLADNRINAFDVWRKVLVPESEGRNSLKVAMVGYVLIQHLPLWLPKIRSDSKAAEPAFGWFPDDNLPYYRLPEMDTWPRAKTPLMPARPESSGSL